DLLRAYPHLKKAIIVPSFEEERGLTERLARACAWYLCQTTDGSVKIGVSCGSTLHAVTAAFAEIEQIQRPDRCEVYALLIPMTSEVVDTTTTALVANLLGVLPKSKGWAYQLPREWPQTELRHDGHKKKDVVSRTRAADVF